MFHVVLVVERQALSSVVVAVAYLAPQAHADVVLVDCASAFVAQVPIIFEEFVDERCVQPRAEFLDEYVFVDFGCLCGCVVAEHKWYVEVVVVVELPPSQGDLRVDQFGIVQLAEFPGSGVFS